MHGLRRGALVCPDATRDILGTIPWLAFALKDDQGGASTRGFGPYSGFPFPLASEAPVG